MNKVIITTDRVFDWFTTQKNYRTVEITVYEHR